MNQEFDDDLNEDDKGKIVFQHVDPNYRVRLAPEVLLAAAKAAVE